MKADEQLKIRVNAFPFGSVELCSKCTGERKHFQFKYQPRSRQIKANLKNLPFDPHLEVSCGSCGFVWEENCADEVKL